jgi:DNA-directed RNA polymerase subunit RPC12/RpoP
MLSVFCPQCGQSLKYLAEYEGRKVSCPKCNARFVMQGMTTPPPPPVVVPAFSSPENFSSRDEPAAQPSSSDSPFAVIDRPCSSTTIRRPRPGNNNLIFTVAVSAACVIAVSVLGAVLLTQSQNGDFPAPQSQKPSSEDVSSAAAVVFLFVYAAASLMLYVLPTAIAFIRKHQNAPAIAALNILLGWSCLGWIAALVWSFTEVRSRDHYHYHIQESPFSSGS